ncbi:MAG: hypothetical protein ACC631_11675, partial [Halocynthiibacter sp.]
MLDTQPTKLPCHSAKSDRVERDGLWVAPTLANFVETQALPGSGVSEKAFWSGFSELVHELGPINRALLQKRETLQTAIDDWHIARRGQAHDAVAYKSFLQDIGYLLPEGADFSIDT